MKITWSEAAKNDLKDAGQYYFVAGGKELRRKFRLHIRTLVRNIESFPQNNGFAIDEIRSKSSLRYPYTIYYRIIGQGIRIIRVWHHSQDRG